MGYDHFGPEVNFTADPNNGGNPQLINVNQWYEAGDVAYIIIASAMVLIMVPGLGFLYSGLARRKSALSLIWVTFGALAVITFQWYFWGYSLAFSATATNGFIGNLHHFAMQNSLAQPSQGSPLIPDMLYAFYQLQFAAVTGAITVGAVAERGRLVPAMVFIFFWTTLVYCPIACWAWNTSGWGYKYGVMDYAGGGPVEIGSGLSALAYSWILGKRHERMMINFRPHNVSMITLGTVLLWFGWLGFNGGSAFGANLRAIYASWNSNLAAVFGGVAWVLMDYRLSRKWSMVGFCSGIISGLVAATPASGYINIHSSILLGVVSGVLCNLATKVKFFLRIDDSLDVFAEHGVGGIIGLIFNALFAQSSVIALDGVNVTIDGGWLDHNWKQLYIQIAYICAACGWAFTMSAILAFIINKIPGLQLRASERGELHGMDDDQLGEFAYDYVEVRRDYLAWTPVKHEPSNESDAEIPAGDRHGIRGHSDLVAEVDHEEDEKAGLSHHSSSAELDESNGSAGNKGHQREDSGPQPVGNRKQAVTHQDVESQS